MHHPPRPATSEPAVTIAEAATLAGRSPSWIRAKRDFGGLDGVLVDGRQGVTLASLTRFLAARLRREEQHARRRKRPHLRLVIDNTRV